MRDLVYTGFVSLDGVVDSPGGGPGEDHRSGGWVVKDIEFLPEAFSLKGEELEDTTALMFGRRSYEAFAPAWRDSDDHAAYKELPKYVVSATLPDDALVEGWGPTTILRSTDGRRRAEEERGWRDLHPWECGARATPVGRGPDRPVQPARLPGAARSREEPVQQRGQGQAGTEPPGVRGLPERCRKADLRRRSADPDPGRSHRRCPRGVVAPYARRTGAAHGPGVARRSTRAWRQHRRPGRRRPGAPRPCVRVRSAVLRPG